VKHIHAPDIPHLSRLEPSTWETMQRDRVFIFQTANAYLTLSHFWGKNRPIATTKKTLQKHCQILKLSALPRTFRDTVIITRRLGQRYLWIDSLCIVHDSVEDWQTESSKTASVNYFGILNIAAESSRNDNDGIFRSAGRRTRERTGVQLLQLPCHSISRNLQGHLYATL
jgi:hypothetical protein